MDAGYRIVWNMGDLWSDLNGKACGAIRVKLLNPFYYLRDRGGRRWSPQGFRKQNNQAR